MKPGKTVSASVKKCRAIAMSWLLLFCSLAILKAEPVDVEKAKAVALTQLRRIAGEQVRLRSAASLDLVYEPKNDENQAYFYVFNRSKGFVIVSGDDRAIPILGYSEDGCFDPDSIPPNMAEFLKGYQREIDIIVKNDIKPASDLQKKWQSLEKNGDIQTRSYALGTNLIQSGWGQGAPFNNYCPVDYSGSFPQRTTVGCVATAMAQIIRYWGADRNIAPTHGFNGSVFETAYYDYPNMPAAINATFPQEQQHAVALLSYHCGLAANMNYSITGSEATMMSAAKGLRDHFGYSDVLCVGYGTVTSISLTELKNILKSELDKEQPVLYAGGRGSSGHAFICDGYNSSDEFHMNWGWNSHCNGWYRLTALNPDDKNYSYDLGATIIYNIYPVRDVNISGGNRSVIYVTPEGGGTRDGSSWENASSDLHGVVQQNYSEPKQIWVKKGTYYGNTSAGSGSAAFVISENNRVYGGFEGYESSLEERQLLNPSILDGQQARRVLYQVSDFTLSDISIWDGFTIQNGLSDQRGTSNIDPHAEPMVNGSEMTGNGGGAYLKKNGILRNCIIINCIAISGGGVFNNDGEIINCSFYNNQAENAGALYNSSEGIVQLSNCVLDNNNSTGVYGGGIFNSGQLYIYEGTGIRNNNSERGGGLYNNGTITLISGNISYNTGTEGAGIYSEGNVYMSGGLISHNKALVSGGGVFASKKLNSNTMHRFSGGSILNNISNSIGGGITVDNGDTYIMDSVKIQGNYASERGGGIYSKGGGVFSNGYLYLISGMIGTNTSIAPNSIEEAMLAGGNYANEGGGIFTSGYLQYNHYDEETSIIIGGNYAKNGGGIYLNSLSQRAEFRKNIIICGNTATNNGGGMYCIKEFHMNGCKLIYNNAVKGGGLYFENTVANRHMSISNGLISENSAQEGGGVYNQGKGSAYQTFYMSGGVISGNNAEKGSGMYNYGSGQYIISDSAKISDVVYLREYTYLDVNTCYLQPYNLTYHINNSYPIPIEVSYASRASIIAKYNTVEEAITAVNNEIYTVSNYGWRPVAEGFYVKLEQYTPPVVVENVVYVTPEGSGRKDGSSWENATPDLYGEMMKDRTDVKQIWVKKGIYYGDTTVGQGKDKAAFIIGKRNNVYGGFAGNESSLSARTQYNTSILDGQNSRRVLCQLTDFADADSSFIDGFTIRNGIDTIAGSANIKLVSGSQAYQSGTDMTGNGGGVYLRTNGLLKNCIIENCKAVSGGGVFNYGGKVTNCSFINNEAKHAGGVFNRGFASLKDCTISNNKTTYLQGGVFALGYGGGIYNMGTLHIHKNTAIEYNHSGLGSGLYNAGTMIMYGGSIVHHTSGYLGGGIYNDNQVTIYNGNISYNERSGIVNHGMLTLYGGTISNNVTTGPGGGINNYGTLNISGSSVKIIQNVAQAGGGIYLGKGAAKISAGTIGIMANQAPESKEEALAIGGNVSLGYGGGGGIYVKSSSTLNFANENNGDIVIGGNYSDEYGGGIYSCGTNLSYSLPANVYICANMAEGYGGGIYSSGETITLNGCNILNNKAKIYGGGIWNNGYLYMSDGKLSGNEAINNGGAIFNNNSGSLNVYGGEISGNSASQGNGIYNSSKKFSLYGSIKMNDILYIPNSYYAVSLGNLTYHTDSSKPITIQGNTGYYVAISSYAQSYIDQGILISTPGLYPVVRNNSYVYLYSSGTRSLEQQSATVNELVDLKEISVYPTLINSGGTLTIESPDGGMASIWNMSGIAVGQYKLEYGKNRISVSYPSGNYVIRIKTHTGKEKALKIIIK